MAVELCGGWLTKSPEPTFGGIRGLTTGGSDPAFDGFEEDGELLRPEPEGALGLPELPDVVGGSGVTEPPSESSLGLPDGFGAPEPEPVPDIGSAVPAPDVPPG